MAQHWSLAFALPLWILILACPELPDGVQCPTQCTCYSAEWIVQCSNASLYSLPSNFPQDAVELDLKFNHFGSLPTDFFPDLPELTTLYLGSSCVHQIEAGTFGGLKNLYHLHLDHNLLEVIPEGAFQNLTKLVFLHLEHNQIASILPGAFSSLKQLSVLDLSHNLLTELSDQTLCGLQQLRQLYLSTNLLVSLSDRALPGSLRVLNLDWNRLRSVPVAVHSAVRLSSLDLSGNLIKELTSLSFGRKLGSLKQLFLENLTLENVTTSAFKRLRRLEVLSLKNNSLETLPSLSSYLRDPSTSAMLKLSRISWSCSQPSSPKQLPVARIIHVDKMLTVLTIYRC
uniref:LRRNT domain-containing protein n=1 Tax=Salvator merianae TaxID=96440 RepID=A0A8D0CFI0_SALMN